MELRGEGIGMRGEFDAIAKKGAIAIDEND